MKSIVYPSVSLVSLLLLGNHLPTFAQEVKVPNVIYIFPDQFRNHAMGFWSESDFKEYVNFKADPVYTPHLNKLARESIVLTSAMSNCPLSSPHRGMLLTGMFPENSGVPLNCNSNRPISSLPDEAICVSDLFSQAGYNCAYIGKLHLNYPTPNDPDRPGHYVEDKLPAWDAYTPPAKRHGFDYWYSYGTFDVHKQPHYWDTEGVKHEVNEWSPEHETQKVLSYLRNEKRVRDESKPFFMMVSFNPPHNPYASTDDCMEIDYNLYKERSVEELLVRPNVDLTLEKARLAPYYFASITGIDRAVGRILHELEQLGLVENTVLVFSSDHGETMCSQGTNDPKNSPYIESLNVPFLLRYPAKIAPGIDTELLLSSPDIMPTLLGICGLENQIPTTVEGRNYASRFMDVSCSTPLREGALYLRNTDGVKDADGKVISYFPIARGIKTHQHTLALTLDKQTKQLKELLLFDDVRDPYQQNPLLYEEHPELVHSLLQKMVPLLKEANDPWYKEQLLKELIPYSDKLINP
ncbi:MAG: sulfatase family protein [Phocaeicola sp.]